MTGVQTCAFRSSECLAPLSGVPVAWTHGCCSYIGSSLTPELRRKHDRELFKIYIDELNSKASVPFALGTAWDEYCRQTLYGISVVINTRSNIEESARGLGKIYI